MHARHRHVIEIGIIERTLEIGVHANPIHLAIAADLVFADDGNVVFRLASNEARVAPNAGVRSIDMPHL